MKSKIVAVLVAVSFLAGCETSGPKQTNGAIIGAVAGGIIGSQFGGGTGERVAAGLIGAAAGGLIGGAIGAQLDAQDRARLDQITVASMRTGSSRSFRNPKTNVRGSTKVISSTASGGQQCRTVEQQVVLANGSVSKDTVRGCKGPNGWSV